MDPEARDEVRFLRRSLVWFLVVLVGVALLATVFLGVWVTPQSLGPQLQNASVQSTPFNPAPLIVLGLSCALIVAGLVGLGSLRRSRRRLLLNQRAASE
jgi:hypothetical protein